MNELSLSSFSTKMKINFKSFRNKCDEIIKYASNNEMINENEIIKRDESEIF